MQNLLFYILMLFATKTNTPNQKSNANDIASAVEQLRIAMVKVDQQNLLKLTSPLLSYGHSNGVIEDQATFVESMVTGKYKFLTISLSNQQIIPHGNVAIVRHDFFAVTKDRDKPEGKIKLHIMSVWKKEGIHWVLIARQAIKILSQ